MITALKLIAFLVGLVLYLGIGSFLGARFEDQDNPVNLDLMMVAWILYWPACLFGVGLGAIIRVFYRAGVRK